MPDPEKTAFIMGGSGVEVDFATLDAAANRVAHLFRRLGLRRGDVVAVLMENNRDYVEFCWAAQHAGLYYCCISPHLTRDEARYILADCGARLLLTSITQAPLAAQLVDGLPALDHRLMAGGVASGFLAWETVVAAEPATPIADPSDGADLLYSSGTTGRPKGVKVALPAPGEGTLDRMVRTNGNFYGLDASSVYLSPGPLYHAAPLRWLLASLKAGATVVVMEKFDPERALALIERHRVTHAQWVPTMFVRLLKLPDDHRLVYDLSSLACAVHAAAPCPIEIKERMIDWWGPIVWEYYAGTEANGATIISSPEWLDHKGSVGRAVLGEIHVMNDRDEEVPARQQGVIYFGNGPAFEYLNDPDKTASSRNGRGWSTLGDIGWVDEEGYLYLTDRIANMIISGGVNIYPQEIENILICHPEVTDVAVIGVPDDDFGEAVKAVVQPASGEGSPRLAAELIALCRDRLAGFKCPRSVDFVDSLPRHPNGKLFKRMLRDRYWAGRQARI